MSCYKCKCNMCIYSCELGSQYITAGEVQNVEDICWCCDECSWYDGDIHKRSQKHFECEKHRYPKKYIQMRKMHEEMKAERRRRCFRVLDGNKDTACSVRNEE